MKLKSGPILKTDVHGTSVDFEEPNLRWFHSHSERSILVCHFLAADGVTQLLGVHCQRKIPAFGGAHIYYKQVGGGRAVTEKTELQIVLPRRFNRAARRQ